LSIRCVVCGFFFQAEDGIRDWSVTGVQTCALPILNCSRLMMAESLSLPTPLGTTAYCASVTQWKPFSVVILSPIGTVPRTRGLRSEERRVGKERRSGWAGDR